MTSQRISAAELVERARDVLAQRNGIDADDIDPGENLLTSGLVDSVGMMRLINDLEELLDVEVPAQELVPENFQTIAVMAEYLVGLSG